MACRTMKNPLETWPWSLNLTTRKHKVSMKTLKLKLARTVNRHLR